MSVEEQVRRFVSQLEQVAEEVKGLLDGGKFAEGIEKLQDCTRVCTDELCAGVLADVLADPDFRRRLRELGGRLGCKSNGCIEIEITLPGGTRKKVRSPYFVKARPKSKRKRKRGPNGTGRHLALELFGFVDKVAPNLAFRAMQMAALCPSFEVAAKLLGAEGIDLSPEKLRRLCGVFDDLTPVERVDRSVAEDESLQGTRVLLSVDGGRYRRRKNKRGRIPKGRKRHGYHTHWKEPLLFTITVLDEDGKPVKQLDTQVDGSIGGYQKFLRLLRAYLERLKIGQAREVILVADGAPWIWEHLPQLLFELGLPPERLHETIDWCHAVQNLEELKKFLCSRSARQWQRLETELRDLLYNGEVEALRDRLDKEVRPSRRAAMRRKFASYFEANRHRFQYAERQRCKQPIGSGTVESAIRRVINLRIKAPGSFWLEAKAETMLFLRAKLLYGRWDLLVNAWTGKLPQYFQTRAGKQKSKAA